MLPSWQSPVRRWHDVRLYKRGTRACISTRRESYQLAVKPQIPCR